MAMGKKVAYQSTPGPASIMARKASTCGRRAVGAANDGWEMEKEKKKKKNVRGWGGRTSQDVMGRRLLSVGRTL
jgi:hypothetical protein